MLNAIRECNRLVAAHKLRKAARIASAYHFVSPVSCALINNNETSSETEEDEVMEPQRADDLASSQTASAEESSSSDLQGATNGTIGAQGADATVIQGINTAGSVRVNNLANLEALLNIFANLGEIGCLVGGGALALNGFANKTVTAIGKDIELGPGGKIVAGILLALIGLATPGVLHWFVASARGEDSVS